MSDTPYDPALPLRADATNEDLMARHEVLTMELLKRQRYSEYDDLVVSAAELAREYAAACVAAALDAHPDVSHATTEGDALYAKLEAYKVQHRFDREAISERWQDAVSAIGRGCAGNPNYDGDLALHALMDAAIEAYRAASAPVVTREQVETLRRFTEGEPDFCDPDGEYLLRADVLALFDARLHA